MSIVERYHALLCRSFYVIKKEAREVEDDSTLQMAIKVANEFVEPDRLAPTLLLFGTLPRLGLLNDKQAPLKPQCLIAMQKGTYVMSNRFASRQVRAAMGE